MNTGYSVARLFPDLFFIGTDGGGEAYAFKISGNDGAFFEVPFIGMPRDARITTDSFGSFVGGASLDPDFVNE